VLLSIHQWLSKYFPYDHLKHDPSFLCLDCMSVSTPPVRQGVGMICINLTKW
jgi:hypothetical protein